jgi:hypothetical protein
MGPENETEKWKDLWRQAEKEPDSRKLMDLIARIDQELEQQDAPKASSLRPLPGRYPLETAPRTRLNRHHYEVAGREYCVILQHSTLVNIRDPIRDAMAHNGAPLANRQDLS